MFHRSNEMEEDSVEILSPEFVELLSDRIVWPYGDVSLEHWLSTIRPSQTSTKTCEWIQVYNNVPSSDSYFDRSSSPATMDFEPYHVLLDQLAVDLASTIIHGVKQGRRTACRNALVEIAAHQKFTVGKWMLFFNESNVDESWERIARATALGQLGSSAKVSPAHNKNNQPLLCCVYVDDFTNHTRVKRVLLTLEEMGFSVRAGFKPDFFTYLDIYTKNRWGLSPALYSPEEAREW